MLKNKTKRAFIYKIKLRKCHRNIHLHFLPNQWFAKKLSKEKLTLIGTVRKKQTNVFITIYSS